MKAGSRHGWMLVGMLWLGAALLLAACTDVRPVAKIGLIAPFEGLYRRTGYAALEQMRAAIAGAADSQPALIPLALDDSANVYRSLRAAQKLLVDPTVQAIVGPLAPAQGAAAAAAIRAAGVPWILPYAVAPAGGFVDPARSNEWATGLIAAAGSAARRQGAQILVLAGDSTGWPALSSDAWAAVAGMPVARITGAASDAATLTGDEAIFWLGAPAAAADFLNGLRPLYPEMPVWIGQGGSDPVLAERAQSEHRLYWVVWSNPHYTGWAAHSASTPEAFLVYQATQAAIAAALGAAVTSTVPWTVELFEYAPDGLSRPFTPGP